MRAFARSHSDRRHLVMLAMAVTVAVTAVEVVEGWQVVVVPVVMECEDMEEEEREVEVGTVAGGEREEDVAQAMVVVDNLAEVFEEAHVVVMVMVAVMMVVVERGSVIPVVGERVANPEVPALTVEAMAVAAMAVGMVGGGWRWGWRRVRWW